MTNYLGTPFDIHAKLKEELKMYTDEKVEALNVQIDQKAKLNEVKKDWFTFVSNNAPPFIVGFVIGGLCVVAGTLLFPVAAPMSLVGTATLTASVSSTTFVTAGVAGGTVGVVSDIAIKKLSSDSEKSEEK